MSGRRVIPSSSGSSISEDEDEERRMKTVTTPTPSADYFFLPESLLATEDTSITSAAGPHSAFGRVGSSSRSETIVGNELDENPLSNIDIDGVPMSSSEDELPEKVVDKAYVPPPRPKTPQPFPFSPSPTPPSPSQSQYSPSSIAGPSGLISSLPRAKLEQGRPSRPISRSWYEEGIMDLSGLRFDNSDSEHHQEDRRMMDEARCLSPVDERRKIAMPRPLPLRPSPSGTTSRTRQRHSAHQQPNLLSVQGPPPPPGPTKTIGSFADVTKGLELRWNGPEGRERAMRNTSLSVMDLLTSADSNRAGTSLGLPFIPPPPPPPNLPSTSGSSAEPFESLDMKEYEMAKKRKVRVELFGPNWSPEGNNIIKR
jgi:hypothetical protein